MNELDLNDVRTFARTAEAGPSAQPQGILEYRHRR